MLTDFSMRRLPRPDADPARQRPTRVLCRSMGEVFETTVRLEGKTATMLEVPLDV
jgi:hypothetical protein